MRIKRSGKCKSCRTPVSETKEFSENVDMFSVPSPAGTITADLKNQINAWRRKPLYCDRHRPERKE